jgi:hypothetical protein
MITRYLIVLSFSASLFSTTSGLGHHTYLTQCRGCEASETGSIKGQVIDREGNPVSGITVYAETQKSDIILGEVPTATTDKAGEFIFRTLNVGVYHIYAVDEARGYPPLSALIYQSGNYKLLANVQKNQETSVRVILGDKLGKLVGKVIDVETGRPVTNAAIQISLADQYGYSIQSAVNRKGGFRMLLPNTPCKVEIFADGYQTWDLKKWAQNKGEETVVLESGETKNITVELVPNK